MRISDEERFNEEVAFEFDGGAVDGEAEDLEDSGDDLEEADPVASADDEGGGVAGGGGVDGDGGGGGGSGVAGGSSEGVVGPARSEGERGEV